MKLAASAAVIAWLWVVMASSEGLGAARRFCGGEGAFQLGGIYVSVKVVARLAHPPARYCLTHTSPAPRWRIIVTPAAPGAENMALDDALMNRARTSGEWVARLYSWSRPTISLGRNQTARGRYDLERIRELGLDMVRRPTGGRAILHDREITYSVTAPMAETGDLRQAYDRINRLVLETLHRLGVYASIAAPRKRASFPGMAPCFDEPSAGELVLDGRKIAGSAQWRADGGILQHGSILLEDDQSLLASLALERSS